MVRSTCCYQAVRAGAGLCPVVWRRVLVVLVGSVYASELQSTHSPQPELSCFRWYIRQLWTLPAHLSPATQHIHKFTLNSQLSFDDSLVKREFLFPWNLFKYLCKGGKEDLDLTETCETNNEKKYLKNHVEHKHDEVEAALFNFFSGCLWL